MTHTPGASRYWYAPRKNAAFIRKIDHRLPSWAIEIAKAQKRERRLHHNAAVHPEQKAREQHVRQVRQNVPHGNIGAAVAENPAAFDKRLCVQLQNLCAHGARRADPAERRNQDDQVRGGTSKKRRQNNERNEL